MSGPQQQLRGSDFAKQLLESAVVQFKGDRRAAVEHIIDFLIEAIVHTISSTVGGSDVMRKELLKAIGEQIASAEPIKP